MCDTILESGRHNPKMANTHMARIGIELLSMRNVMARTEGWGVSTRKRLIAMAKDKV